MHMLLQPNRHNWMIVFYIAAAVYAAGTVVYSLIASGVEQEWNTLSGKFEERKLLIDSDNNPEDSPDHDYT